MHIICSACQKSKFRRDAVTCDQWKCSAPLEWRHMSVYIGGVFKTGDAWEHNIPFWKCHISNDVPLTSKNLQVINYANPVYAVATICHQVRWLRWGHPSLFHTATSLLIWYKVFCVRDISYRLMWVEFINMFSVYAQSGTHSRFNW